MRLNQFLAQARGISRRSADRLVETGTVTVNGRTAQIGQSVDPTQDQIADAQGPMTVPAKATIIFHKPTGYVSSRAGQGSHTIYEVLPVDASSLKSAGRLDKDSSGLMILSNDGHLLNQLAHPSGGKIKRYEVTLDRDLLPKDREHLEQGVRLSEGISRLKVISQAGPRLTLTMETGWNRQIRRTIGELGYQVAALKRVAYGQIELGSLGVGNWREPQVKEQAWLSSL